MTHAPDDVFVVSSSTALGVGENLVLLLNTVIKNLPEAELRKLRHELQSSVRIADDLLFNMSISSDFEMLTLGDVSSTVTAVGSGTVSRSSSAVSNPVPPTSPVHATVNDSDNFVSPAPNRGNKIRHTSLPIPTPDLASTLIPAPTVVPAPVSAPVLVPVPAPNIVSPPAPNRQTLNDRARPMIISSRPHVGRPNYMLHPHFVRPGIPGSYTQPPVDSSMPGPAAYYVVTKGLYVGVFTSWNECSPWVTRVAGSVFCKVRSWEEAKNLYNSRLTADSCEVLS